MSHPAFLAALEADRHELNQRFKLVSSQGAPLDGQAFKEHLTTRVAPIVAAVAESFPERTRLATRELYQVSLELFRAGYWTSETRLPELNRLWQEVLPKLGPLVAREPERISGSLSNALVNLAGYSVRLDQWLSELAQVGPRCEHVAQLLEVSSVLAWRAGMTLLRRNSLTLLHKLPPMLAAEAIGYVPADDDAHRNTRWSQLLNRLAEDRWFNPATESESVADAKTESRSKAIREATRVGDYRAMGGSLLDLPQVFLHSGALHVTDQQNNYRIEVDCFGCILQTVRDVKLPEPTKPSKTSPKSADSPMVDSAGNMQWHDHQVSFRYLADANSQAFDGQTLAVTLPTSFHVYLFAMMPFHRLATVVTKARYE